MRLGTVGILVGIYGLSARHEVRRVGGRWVWYVSANDVFVGAYIYLFFEYLILLYFYVWVSIWVCLNKLIIKFIIQLLVNATNIYIRNCGRSPPYIYMSIFSPAGDTTYLYTSGNCASLGVDGQRASIVWIFSVRSSEPYNFTRVMMRTNKNFLEIGHDMEKNTQTDRQTMAQKALNCLEL